MRLRRSAITALMIGAVGAFGLAACGGDDDSSSGSASTGSSAATTNGAGTAASGATDPSKPPVVLALHALKIPSVDLLTPYEAGAKAAADEINAKGGFGGR